jgi:Ca2+-binding RTX toxin-like protein
MSRTPRRTLVLTTAGGLSLLLAAPAVAATTPTVSGGTVGITASVSGDSAAITCNANVLTLNAAAVVPTTACNAITDFDIQLDGGNNALSFPGATAATFPAVRQVRIDSANGFADPNVTGSPYDDIVTADALDTVSTGDGSDRITGGLVAVGGDGNNRYISPAGTVTGGQGSDIVEFDYTGAPDTAVSVGITPTTYTINGASRAQTGVEAFVLSMPDGVNNVSDVNSSTYAGRVVLRLHSGADTFTGGSGDDFVDAGPGTDVVNPGAGNDQVRGGEGSDTINVQDGQVDEVDCGDGTDTVTADRADVVKNCETVNLPPLPAPAPPAAPETSQVVGLKYVKRGAKASFVFVTPTAGAGFQCRLDNRSWRVCASPFKVNTRKLKLGKHKVFVRAALTGGNVDATPSKFVFRVQKPKKRR